MCRATRLTPVMASHWPLGKFSVVSAHFHQIFNGQVTIWNGPHFAAGPAPVAGLIRYLTAGRSIGWANGKTGILLLLHCSS